jgi:hypothetical protein
MRLDELPKLRPCPLHVHPVALPAHHQSADLASLRSVRSLSGPTRSASRTLPRTSGADFAPAS